MSWMTLRQGGTHHAVRSHETVFKLTGRHVDAHRHREQLLPSKRYDDLALLVWHNRDEVSRRFVPLVAQQQVADLDADDAD